MIQKLRKWIVAIAFMAISMSAAAQLGADINGPGGVPGIANTNTLVIPWSTVWEDGRHQYLYRASELIAAGVTPGIIDSLGIYITSVGSPDVSNMEIKVKLTAAMDASVFDPAGMVLVYSSALHTPFVGLNAFKTTTPVLWDGVSNLLVEFCYDNTAWSSGHGTRASNAGFPATYYYFADGAAGCSMTTGSNGAVSDRPDLRISVLAASGRDARMTALIAPTNLIVGNNQVVARIANVAADPISSVDLAYQLNNNPPVTVAGVAIPTPLTPGQGFNYTFATPLSITTPGSYTLRVWLSNANGLGPDNNTSNDTIVRNICTGLTGTITVGPTGTYPNIAAAVADLNNCGISQSVTFSIQPGTYYGSYTLTNILGAVPPNSITFTSSTSNAADVILIHDTAAAAANKTIFNVIGTPSVNFSLMTFRRTVNAPTGTFSQVRFASESNFGTVIGCVFDDQTPLATTSFSNYGIFADNADNLNITGNTFNGFYYTIYLTGPTTNSAYESFNQITNNTITNYRYGVYGINQSMTNVSANIISTAASTFGYGIYMSRIIGMTVSENTISGTLANGGMFIVNANDSLGLENRIVNNSVSGQSFLHTGGFTSLYGIYLSGSFSSFATAPVNPRDRVEITHNSVNIGANPTAGATTLMAPLFLTGGSNTTPAWNGASIRNNMLVAYQPSGANPASGMRSLYFSHDSLVAVSLSNYNNLYLYDEANGVASTNAVVRVAGIEHLTRADWTTASTQDANSISRNPGFSSSTLAIPTAFLTDNLGTPIANVTTDILGAARNATTPDIGAYEFTPSPFDLGITAVISNSACADSNQAVRVTVKNVGFQAFNFATNNSVLTLTVGGPIPQGFTLNINTDSLQVDSSRTYLVSSAVNYSTAGAYTLTADLTAPTDGNVLNNTGTRTISFATSAPLPFSQNFNGLTTLPNGFATNMGFDLITGFSQTPGLRYNVYASNASSVTLPLLGPVPGPGYIFEYAYKMTTWGGWVWPGTALPLGVGDTIRVEVSTNCGVSFQTISNLTDQNYVASNQFAFGRLNLTPYAGQRIALRISFRQSSGIDVYFDLDNFRIFLPPPVDLSVDRILRPNSGCGLGSDTVSVRLINKGTAAQSAFPLLYAVNGATPVSETFAGTINPGDTVIYNFTTLTNLSLQGSTYNFVAYHGRAGDADLTNDTSRTSVTNIPVINTFPYVQGWENGNGGWLAGGAASSWALGTPTVAGGAAPAYSGNNAWVTNLAGDYNNGENSNITSPCFDLSALSNVRVKFGVWFETEQGWDGANLQFSTNGGSTWTVAGTVGSGINWYTSATVISSSGQPVWANIGGVGSGAWLPAEITLPQLAGQASVRFRFNFTSDGSGQAEGIGIDSFIVDLPTDPTINTVTVATDSCINASRAITANVTQFRLLTSVNLHYNITNTSTYTAIPMTRVGTTSNWTATIPVSAPVNRNRYFVSVVDSLGLRDTSNVTSYTDNYLSVTVFPTLRNAAIGDTVILRARAVGIANVKITEIVQFRVGTGATVAYPAYVTGQDLVEISNLGSGQADLSGFGFEVFGAGARTYTFPSGAVIAGNSVLVLHLGLGTDLAPNAYYNTGGGSDAISSASITGYVLKNLAGVIVDVVASNGYIFDVTSGVTTANWSGTIAAMSGFAGASRINSDNNTASDWVKSSIALPMTVGALNPGMILSTPAGGIVWNTTPPTNGDTLVVGPFTTAGTFIYTATVSDGRCTAAATSTVVVGNSAPDIGVSLVATPASGTVITNTSPINVSVRMKNYGGVPATGFDVEYRVNGGASIITNSVTQTIAPGDSMMHTFTLAWTPPATGGTFTICANTTGMPNEVNRANDTSCLVLTSTVSVEELAANGRLIGKVYPNPAESFVNFAFNEFQGKGTLEIHDNLGRLVATIAVDRENGKVQTVRTDSWSAGMYSYRFIAADQVQHGNLIIKN